MTKKSWYAYVGEDSLEVLASEVEELENDEKYYLFVVKKRKAYE